MKLRRRVLHAIEATEEGYTLLELLVVILILALIVAIAAPKVIGYFSSSKTHAAEIQISNIAAAVDLYRLDVGRYPNQEEGLKALVEKPTTAKNWNGPYLTRRDGIIDPWDAPYLYALSDGGTKVVISSFGADGKVGGTGENADVTSDH